MKFLRELLFPLIAVIAAFLVGAILILIIGDDPLVAYKLLIGSALSWPDGIGYTLFYAVAVKLIKRPEQVVETFVVSSPRLGGG